MLALLLVRLVLLLLFLLLVRLRVPVLLNEHVCSPESESQSERQPSETSEEEVRKRERATSAIVASLPCKQRLEQLFFFVPKRLQKFRVAISSLGVQDTLGGPEAVQRSGPTLCLCLYSSMTSV